MRRRRLHLPEGPALWLVGILVGAFGLRVWALWRAHTSRSTRVLTVDSLQYLASARSLVDNLGYNVEPGGPPATLRPPGYPAFIAAVWALTPDSPWWVLAAQVVVAVAGLGLLYCLAVRLLASQLLALAATGLVAVDPIQVLASGQVLSEALFTTLIVAMVLACAIAFEQGPPARAYLAGAGCLLAAATLVRPSTYYLPLLLAAIVLAWAWHQGRRTAAVAAVALVLPSVVVCGAWQLRNQHQIGSSTFAGTEGFTLYFYAAAGAEAIEDGREPSEVRQDYKAEVGTFSTKSAQYGQIPDRYPTVGAWYDDLRRRGARILLSHPRGAARMMAESARAQLVEAPTRPFEEYTTTELPPWIGVLHTLLPVALLVGTVLGAGRLVRHGERSTRFGGMVLVATAAFLILTSSGGQTDTRFRAPVTPFLAVAAIAGVQQLRGAVGTGVRGLASRRGRGPSGPLAEGEQERTSTVFWLFSAPAGDENSLSGCLSAEPFNKG